MLAYSAQDLILEPFVGLTFGWSVGETTALAGVQHGGMLLGMFAMASTTYAFKTKTRHLLHIWIRGGCIISGISLAALALGGLLSSSWPIHLNVFILGTANGGFAVAAIGGMMMLANQGETGRDGLRMGLWGAAQAISFALWLSRHSRRRHRGTMARRSCRLRHRVLCRGSALPLGGQPDFQHRRTTQKSKQHKLNT